MGVEKRWADGERATHLVAEGMVRWRRQERVGESWQYEQGLRAFVPPHPRPLWLCRGE